MAQTVDMTKREILPYILKYYEKTMTLLMNKYDTIERVECEKTKKSINSAIAYLCRNLAQVILSLEDILTITPDNERLIVEDFISEIHFTAILLRSPVEGNIGELIDNVITTVENISDKVLNFINKVYLNVYEFTEFEYQLLEIVFEIGSSNIKLLVFTTGLLEYDYLIANYKSASEIIFSSLKQILLKDKDGLLVFEFARYIKCSIKLLNNYLEYIQKTIQLPNTLAKIRDLLDTVSEYIIFHISTLSDAIGTDNPVDYMLNNMGQLKNRYFIILQWVNHKVRSKASEMETEKLMHQGVIAFAEIMQSMAVTFEIINCFRIYQL